MSKRDYQGRDFIEFDNGSAITWPSWLTFVVLIVVAIAIFKSCAG